MNGEKLKFLVLENEAYNYLDIKQFLEGEGYEVLSLPGIPIIGKYEDAIQVCNFEIPHIAILDIDLRDNGEIFSLENTDKYKDGIDVGNYIKENFYSPIIFISKYDTDENLRRLSLIDADGFVAKVEKPYDLRQLRATIKRLIPMAEAAARKREEGTYLYIKDYSDKSNDRELYSKKLVIWDNLKFVMTSKDLKNKAVLELGNGKKYIYNKSLTDCQKELPPFFIRFTSYMIINAKFLDGKGRKSEWVRYIDNNRYEISESYRSESTLAIINKYHA